MTFSKDVLNTLNEETTKKKELLHSEEITEKTEVGCRHTSPFFPCATNEAYDPKNAFDLAFKPNYKIVTRITKKIYHRHCDK